ncbi:MULTISPECIES: DUF5133 domain-containing protein [unclassified Streptomyces]|uniref:DUF5133 domain-containing protein n=1 Tax=unclassified Streptomyces TaxID=2593676 RepID=UPI0029B09E41|nr:MULTISPECIES: DUF5133 domain-containing protein [unclassified Streptomyces]MDX3771901.1 DUF5133 domain-containing protein [Streptomyces sp. AK08-01B]MDX3821419.1 DUF5133 domain-containing protein [Streptomyces sp. AK08-01A]
MLLAHPAILRNLVEQYEMLKVLHAEQGLFETRRRLEDITYTLCVSTGTQTPAAALTVAEQQLNAALTEVATPMVPASTPDS